MSLGQNVTTAPSNPKHSAADNAATLRRIVLPALVQIIGLKVFPLLKSISPGNLALRATTDGGNHSTEQHCRKEPTHTNRKTSPNEKTHRCRATDVQDANRLASRHPVQ